MMPESLLLFAGVTLWPLYNKHIIKRDRRVTLAVRSEVSGGGGTDNT